MFFERFREAAARLPDGLIRFSPPASPEAIAGVEARLGLALPAEYASFLRSFDGADLFHETIVVAGVGETAARSLLELNEERQIHDDGDGNDGDDGDRDGELVFAEAVAGDRFALDARGRVLRLRAGSDERILAGSSFERWLDATVARERVLYGADGEFAPDVFDEDGEEISAAVVLRQTERALKVDPGSAEAQHERGLALRRLGRGARALEAFAAASALDPDDPWPWFDFGRTALADGLELPRAREAFRRAATLEAGPSGGRLLAWATRAALLARDEAAVTELRREALARDPALLETLARAESQASLEGDEEARAENEALRLALSPTSSPRRGLRVIEDGGLPPSRAIEDGGLPPSRAIEDGGLPPSRAIEGGGLPPVRRAIEAAGPAPAAASRRREPGPAAPAAAPGPSRSPRSQSPRPPRPAPGAPRRGGASPKAGRPRR
jgi:tetratricopeptide (TPR) repeat protein